MFTIIYYTMTQIAIYPGSFDPMTNGHIDVISRTSSLFDRVIIAISQNLKKPAFIPIQQRLLLVRESLLAFSNVEVMIFNNLLVDFAKSQQARIIIRGLRAVSDFDYEFQLAGMNKKLSPKIETLFITPAEQYANISSSLVREIAQLKGDISSFVPDNICRAIKKL